MIPAHINGLPPAETSDTKVVVFDNRTFGSSAAIRLWEGKPDKNGCANFKLPKKYKNKVIHLVIHNKYFEHLGEKLTVSQLGLYHTVKLNICILHDRVEPLPIDPNKAYLQGQEIMRSIYRKAKHRNYFMALMFFITTVGATFAGWFIADITGLFLGSLLAIISLKLGAYAIGYEKGI